MPKKVSRWKVPMKFKNMLMLKQETEAGLRKDKQTDGRQQEGNKQARGSPCSIPRGGGVFRRKAAIYLFLFVYFQQAPWS